MMTYLPPPLQEFDMSNKIKTAFMLFAIFINVEVYANASIINELSTRLKTPTANDVMVIAHRACWRLAPENSLQAIQECIRIDVDMVEIDVRMTLDGHLIIHHDETVDRMTNGTGEVKNLTLKQIKKLYLKHGAGGDNSGITKFKIPTLQEALEQIHGKILVNLDIVLEHVYEPSLEIAKATKTIDQVIFKMPLKSPLEPKFINAPFHSNGYFMPIFREEKQSLSALVNKFKDIDSVAYEVVFKTTDFLKEGAPAITAQGKRFWINTMWESLAPGYSDDISRLDPDKHWGHLIGLGINMIQTDRPNELIKYLLENNLRK
jgi:glycerophosphoryl diester phosphodiesterase